MPNYLKDSYNDFLMGSRDITRYLSGAYMDEFEGLTLETEGLMPAGTAFRFVNLSQYRKKQDNTTTFRDIKNAIKNAIRTLHGGTLSVAYFLISDGIKVSLYFASEGVNNSFDQLLNESIPDVVFQRNVSPVAQLRKSSAFGGIVTGGFGVQDFTVDGIIDYMQGKVCALAIVASPLPSSEIDNMILSLQDLNAYATALINTDLTFGQNSKTSIKRHFPEVQNLSRLLGRLLSRYQNEEENIWRSTVWFGAATKNDAKGLAEHIKGHYHDESAETSSLKSRYFFTTKNMFTNGCPSFPVNDYGGQSVSIPNGIRKSALQSYLTTEELSCLFQLPANDHYGIHVIDPTRDANSIRQFSVNPPTTTGDTFSIGIVEDSNLQYQIEINDITEHMMITGASGGGKTTSVKRVIGALNDRHIPFCIIESAKKEYWTLVNEIRDLKVYSMGSDAHDFRLNPLEPEDGTRIDRHISDVSFVFQGAFEMEEPTRLTLRELLEYTFKKFNWQMDDFATQERARRYRYPQIQDMIDSLYEYSSTGIASGEEVKKNIEGSILRRLNALNEGSIGRVTKTSQSITGKDLCSQNVLIELDDIADDLKPFVAMMICMKMRSYIRLKDQSPKLENVIFIEEAHNIFAREKVGNLESPADKAGKVMSNMFLEVRGYGTGLVLVDQRASRINSNAISNTKIKIAHSIENEEDVDAEAYA